MLRQVLNALIPEHFTSPAARRAWSVALLLFPVALAAGLFLLLKNTPPLPVPVTVNRAEATSLAREFLIREGLPAGSWHTSCSSTTSNSQVAFANGKPNRIRIWNVAPPTYANCTVKAPGKGENAVVNISLDGRVVGYNLKSYVPSGPELPDESAKALATAQLPAGFQFGPPSIDRNKESRTFTFHSQSLPDADLKVEVVVAGKRVTAVTPTAEPDDSASGGPGAMQTFLTVCGGFYICVVVLFSIYRYASRTLQQEVSHKRSLTVALLCGGFCILCGFNAVVQTDAGTVPLVFIVLAFALLGVMGGALLAAAYGSGEGDVREAFPGKLTSLDTVLSGHALSRNTGASVLFGMACAGWLVLAMGLIGIPFRTGRPFATDAMLAPFIRLWWLMPLVVLPLMSLCYAAAGLLQPLAFLHRFVPKARRWHMPVLIVCAGLVTTLRVHARSTAEFVLSSAIFVIALLLPFFLRDLFAALVCVGMVFAAVDMSANLAAIPAFCWPGAVLLGSAVIIAASVSVLCVAHGKTWSEEQVRPLYACHIAERKSLEAEVSAAREAQLRLLPDSAPEFAGLNISAVCVPAETVGGDFYDFFPLGDGRLGVFIAEGNTRGLAAALTIALAKGYLMQCVERFHEPVEILSRLETALGAMFDRESVATDFAFASIDTVAGEVRYARTSSYPKVVVVSAQSAPASERMVLVKGRGSPIAEGRATLAPGDHVVLFTDGIGRRLAAGNRKPEDAAASLVSGVSEKTADEIRERFFTATKASLEPDDLTVVVIRVQALAAVEKTAMLGVVA